MLYTHTRRLSELLDLAKPSTRVRHFLARHARDERHERATARRCRRATTPRYVFTSFCSHQTRRRLRGCAARGVDSRRDPTLLIGLWGTTRARVRGVRARARRVPRVRSRWMEVLILLRVVRSRRVRARLLTTRIFVCVCLRNYSAPWERRQGD